MIEKIPHDLEAQLSTLATLFQAEITLMENGSIKVIDGDFVSFISPDGGLVQYNQDEEEP